ncbi:MAG TPA: coenzyme F420-0:L-glutamate ligase [Mesorhizobium sp.]|uniref:coenzyme F420-0:L-glutamate ligase n=1 Tax=Mesorhizobium sp. TaxID=1871066 RepID=UPI002DDCB3BB|nr:coenzyme F420-0:L-glutamate ligase [Mesorhizobium sp.]HEV2507862.1 coenzyme F420-0:L-glutamate ligase [Mesorhizobium sp.]
MTVAIAILMKDPAIAKTRLSPVLANDARERLALLLFENTLQFFRRTHPDSPVGIVTASQETAAISRQYGASIVEETGAGGINAAAGRASEWAIAIGATSLLVIHADIATLVDEEVDRLLAARDRHQVVVGVSADGGTNALLLTPPDAIPFCYGPNSAHAHEAAARKSGRSCETLQLACLSRDIDTPQDLRDHFEMSRSPADAQCFAVATIPEIAAGDDVATLIIEALVRTHRALAPGDIVVIAQKVVSKSEGRLVPARQFQPSQQAIALAAEIGKDPHKVEAILSESSDVIRARRQPPDGLLITRHRHGWICANAGIDESNLGDGHDGMLLLLPEDPDASARRIRDGLETKYGAPIGVIVSDTFGRPWRNGLVNIAIGVAGVPAIIDWAGRTDAYGRGLKATLPAFADEVAAAAGLLMQKDAGLPVIVLRGLEWDAVSASSARDVLRPAAQELFL